MVVCCKKKNKKDKTMKFHEKMDSVEREDMFRKAVAFNVSLEGIEDTARANLQATIQQESEKILSTLAPANDQTIKQIDKITIPSGDHHPGRWHRICPIFGS